MTWALNDIELVGNRTQKVATLPGYPGGLSNYNANDQLATDTYDGDGNRIFKTVAAVTTSYWVDDQNPTGYARVLTEQAQHQTYAGQYVYGLEQIVRWHHAPNYLFAGEQFDPDLGLYINRARYLNTSTGRFINRDSFDGDSQAPVSLHKYLYASGDPVDLIDPTGNDDLVSITVAAGIVGTISGIWTGSLKGALLGTAAGGALGFACLNPALCSRAAITGGNLYFLLRKSGRLNPSQQIKPQEAPFSASLFTSALLHPNGRKAKSSALRKPAKE